MEKVRRCIECGHHLPEDAHPLAGLCSKECKRIRNNRARNEKAIRKKKERAARCSECNDLIPAEMKVRSTCSKQCEAERVRRLDRERYRLNPQRRKSCIDSYDNEVRAEWRAKNPESHRAASRERWRLLNAPGSERIHQDDVFKEKGWTCGICNREIDPSLKWPDRNSPSIDHIIPLSKGGKHTKDNVQPAHLGCNASKGNRN